MNLGLMPDADSDRAINEAIDGNYWAHGGAIDIVENMASTESVWGAMMAASVYYSASMRAKAERQLCPWWRFDLLVKSTWRYGKYLDLALERSSVIGSKVLDVYATSEQLHVRAMILSECGFMKEAKLLVITALSRRGLSDRTKASLHVLRAIIYNKEDESERLVNFEFNSALNLLSGLDIYTRVGVRRAFSEYCIQVGDYNTAKTQALLALSLAKEYGSKDQAFKIRPLLRRLSIPIEGD